MTAARVKDRDLLGESTHLEDGAECGRRSNPISSLRRSISLYLDDSERSTGDSCREVSSRYHQARRTCSSLSWRGSTVPGAPVIKSVPLAVLGKAMQSRILVSPE